jgi:hypothetical protein
VKSKINNPTVYPENTGTNNAIEAKMTIMRPIKSNHLSLCSMVTRTLFFHCGVYNLLLAIIVASPCYGQLFSSQSVENAVPLEQLNPENPPQVFSKSLIGIIFNQNSPWGFGNQTWSEGGPSYGGEYRFFYKDTWTLAISGEFKQLLDTDRNDSSWFSLSQESMRVLRLYHPWYLGFGASLMYLVPIRKVAIPYERDQTRIIDTGASASISSIWILNSQMIGMIHISRWRSLSTTKRQGVEVSGSLLFNIR